MTCSLKLNEVVADVLILGGGTAGCYAAITLARKNPNLRIVILEKANIKRSGCLAAGVNAINAYITDGYSVDEYVEYVRWDAAKIIRDDLVRSMALRFNRIAGDLEQMGLVFLKDANGNYVSRGRRNVKINGENIKPILAKETQKYENIKVYNHVNATDLILKDGRVVGAVGFAVEFPERYLIHARAVLIACGGASGLYRPNNPGFSRHKMWYSPFNVGSGYAMGIRAGAEMTSLEMRFVAQRCKDVIAPTGTIALGVGAKEINCLGECYSERYGLSTSGRAHGATNEALEGRGPCYLKTVGVTKEQEDDLLKAYLNMAPAQTLRWLESGRRPRLCNVEFEGSEPYVVGGHTGSGFWVDVDRRATVPRLYAAGDVVGGAPKKFVTGALAEGEIAAEAILADISDDPDELDLSPNPDAEKKFEEYQTALEPKAFFLYDLTQLEEAMQKVMDVYAGGISPAYRYNARQLDMASDQIRQLEEIINLAHVDDMNELLRFYELKDRLLLCRALIAHMNERHETRWPGFGVNTDFPKVDKKWEVFVNSVFTDNEFKMILRQLNPGEDTYEYSH